MIHNNMASVSWGDHLVFGMGEGKLDTPESVGARVVQWKEKLQLSTVLWRESRSRALFEYFSAEGVTGDLEGNKIDWDDFKFIPGICHDQGMKAYLYVTLFDEGRPLLPAKVREKSFHNAMHGRHRSRQSRFTLKNPEYVVINRKGDTRQWGVVCLAYPEVRRHFCQRYLSLLEGYKIDGLFLCLRSQSRPADVADQFGFNEPVRKDYQALYGIDILRQKFDLRKWRDLQGGYLTRFVGELRSELRKRNIRLAIGIPRGDVIGPPIGNWTLQWREWVKQDLVDDLVINQNSSKCPSMWIDLWPMHRGRGYIQNYLDGHNLTELEDQLDLDYQPIMANHSANLFVSRQWDNRDSDKERALNEHPAVSGLVFSTFRFDNPEAVKREDWHA